MKHILDFNLEELKLEMLTLGEKKFRAEQILDALFLGKEIDKANLGKELIELLKTNYLINSTKIIKTQTDPIDHTRKFLFQFADGEVAEGVLMSYKYGNTFCLSTQVGCNMACSFCASTIGGKKRDITTGEMLEMIILANCEAKTMPIVGVDVSSIHEDEEDDGDPVGVAPKGNPQRFIKNLVLMGSGEPLDNYHNVVKFIRNLMASKLNFGARSISLSTCGLVPQIYALAEENLPITLSISLHATTDENRKKIMPIAHKYELVELIMSLKNYVKKTGRRVAVEYTLVKGVNDTDGDAKRLKALLGDIVCFVNIITLNDVGRGVNGTTRQEAYHFVEKLKKAGVNATLRRTLGQNIDAACGQLRNKHTKES